MTLAEVGSCEFWLGGRISGEGASHINTTIESNGHVVAGRAIAGSPADRRMFSCMSTKVVIESNREHSFGRAFSSAPHRTCLVQASPLVPSRRPQPDMRRQMSFTR